MTGESASYGEYTKQGLDLALRDLGDTKIELIYKDTKADPAEAVRVFKELQRSEVAAVIGPFTSTEVRQVGPEAQRLKMPLITSSATADQLSAIGDHVFMVLPPNSKQGEDQAEFSGTSLKATKAAILYRQNPYGETLRASFKRRFESNKGEILADVGFPDGEEDFRERLRQILETSPEVVFIPCHDGDTGRILRQARELNFPPSIRFIGCDGSMSQTMLELAGEAAEGAIFSNVASVSTDFDDKYRKQFGGGEPNPYAAAAYDTLMILGRLQREGAASGDDFQRGLVGLSGYEGATGKTQFTKMEESYWALSKPYRQFKVESGRFVLIK